MSRDNGVQIVTLTQPADVHSPNQAEHVHSGHPVVTGRTLGARINEVGCRHLEMHPHVVHHFWRNGATRATLVRSKGCSKLGTALVQRGRATSLSVTGSLRDGVFTSRRMVIGAVVGCPHRWECRCRSGRGCNRSHANGVVMGVQRIHTSFVRTHTGW